MAAYLLKEQGYDVIGVTMQIWQDQDVFVQSQEGGCCGLSAVDDARRVAERLEIPYYVMNFSTDEVTEIPLCFSISIQSDTACLAVAFPFTEPARLMAPP